MSGKLVTINSYENPAEAHAAKNLLESEGITAYVADEAVGNWLGYMGSAIGGIKLQVAECDAESCLDILERAENEAADNRSADPWRCQRCKETVDAGFEICWSCGGSREEFQDPAFVPQQDDKADEVAAPEESWDEDDGEAEALESAGAFVDGRPNPYYAGVVPAQSTSPPDAMMRPDIKDIEAMVTRAWRASILGILICPMFLLLNMYSVWLLLRVAFSGEELSKAGSGRFLLAWIVNFIAVFVFLTILTITGVFGRFGG